MTGRQESGRSSEPMTLERAIVIAAEAHAGETGKDGGPYILHCLRVMMAVEGHEPRVVAVLHDLLEHAPQWNLDRLRAEGCPEKVLEAIDAMTRRDGEDYFDFARRAAANPLARPVKVADLTDNLATTLKHASPPVRDEKAARYAEALRIVSSIS